MIDARDIINRNKSAQSVANEWRAILNDVYRYAMPDRNVINKLNAGQKKSLHVFDSTAVTSTMNFANRIQSDMMPPFQRWLELKAGGDVEKSIEDDVITILQEVNEVLYSVISQSNFDSAVNEMLLDLATGTGAMLIQAGDEEMPVRYTSIPISELALEEGANGLISAIFRTFDVKIRNIVPTWHDAIIPPEIAHLKDSSKDPSVKLIEATFKDSAAKVWRYTVIHPQTKQVLVERESVESPIVVSRWMKIAGETFGRGVLIQALADIKTLNALTKMCLQNASLAVSGAYMVANDSVLNPNTLQISAGAMIPVTRTAGANGATIAPIPRSGDFNIAELERGKLIDSIKKTLFDEALPPQSGAVRSATEIVQRLKELSRAIGAPFGRLMNEFVTPMTKRTLEVMADQGLIDTLIKVDGKNVKIAVQSPLAKQQSLDDVDNVVQWISMLTQTVGEQALMDSVNLEDIPEFTGEKLGIPQTLIKTKEERAQAKQAKAQQAQSQQEIMQAQAQQEQQKVQAQQQQLNQGA